MKEHELVNNYKNFIKTEIGRKEPRKIIIFARAHLCSSSLLEWGGSKRKELISKEKSDKIWSLLTNNPDSIDNYYVKNFGNGSMNYLTKKSKEVTDKQLKELMRLIEGTEKFIKEELEKGTGFEGEFERKFPQFIKSEEEKWEDYEIEQEINEKD
ncbi:hypothetical protein [endosymbiont GvMRE of Glomus versiforme]|uniref:hypothetical protein n=1 Tax=endosymbiont GvMRE of Glomus versiforme TaxID=2039283 RepID=UPI000EF0D24F|nr:hypothetical protein [endosymbiont GvMRE of Glomus versiforme]RHZ35918.1 hypothetical protein GvMRE_Ic4g28 [endosymbiont GvMRE of Glomus versiforme]